MAVRRKTRTAQWILSLRTTVRDQHGEGWSLREIRGRTQITRRHSDGSRSATVVDIPWEPGQITRLLNTVAQMKLRMDEQRLTLVDAAELVVGSAVDALSPDAVDWPQVVGRFREHKLSSGDLKERTWDRMYAPVMKQALAALEARPCPRTGTALLEALVSRHGGEPGSQGRKLRLQYTRQFLDFAVVRAGAPGQWQPSGEIADLVGKRVVPKEDTTPLKDEDFLRLLSAISDGRWRLAVGLMGCFGLRPVELLHCEVEGSKLLVSYQKRTARGSTRPRLVRGLDPEGGDGLSADLLALLNERGDGGLPPLGKGAGASIGQHLTRRVPLWDSLRKESPGLVPYSLRHGYALRAHQLGIMPRAAAALLGHSLQTHSSHYGRWTDEATVDGAVDAALARRARERAGVRGE